MTTTDPAGGPEGTEAADSARARRDRTASPGTCRIPARSSFRKRKLDSGDPTAGPLVPPGEYTAKLTSDGQSQSQKFTVRPDPRGPADTAGQHEFVMKVRGDFARLVGAVQQLRAVRKQLQDRNELLEGVAKPSRS